MWPVEQSTAFHVFVEGQDTCSVLRFTGRGERDYRPVWTPEMSIYRANRIIYRLLKLDVAHLHVPWTLSRAGNSVTLAPFALAIPNPGFTTAEPWWYHVTAGDAIRETTEALRNLRNAVTPTIWKRLLDD